MPVVPGLRQAAQAVMDGGVVAYPTEAVYGLGCDPANEAALQRLLALKGRAAEKGLIVIASTVEALRELVAPEVMPELAAAMLEASRGQRATTFVTMPAERAQPLLSGAHGTIAVRLCLHPRAAALCERVGGVLVSTSANRAGRRPARSAMQVRRWFGERVDVVIGGAVGADPRPSRIIDLNSGKVIRA